MAAPATADEFLDLVLRSGVTDKARLNAHLEKLSTKSGIPGDPSKLAGILVRDGVLTYFQADQLLQGKWKRFFIGKYKVLERIGVGGMGHVFLCEHKLMRRRVAVKVLPAGKANDASSLERFYREARAAAALDHPNIVHAYDVDQDENLHFLVMEYVDGTNLQDLVKKFGPLDITRACHFIYGAAVGLQHAFELGLVHRDIKPGNILVDRSGVVKLLDMGLARFFHDEEDALTKKYDENILGTADYLAPEQAIDSHGVDIRADIYGLGGTFFYLLSGQPPFPQGTVAQKLLWHQTREPVSLKSLRSDVPDELARIVSRMMAKNADDRFQTPAEVMEALAHWVQTPISPPTDQEMPQLSPAAKGSGGSTAPARGFSGPPTVVSGPNTVSTADLDDHPTKVNSSPPAAAKSAEPAPPPRTPPPPLAVPSQPKPLTQTTTAVGVWEQLATDTSPGSKGDTDRTRRSGTRSNKQLQPTPVQRRKKILATLGGILILGALVGGAVVAYRMYFDEPPQPPAQPPPAAVTWYVTTGRGPDQDRTARSLSDALNRAGTGDTIVILDEKIVDGRVAVSSRNRVKNGIRVEAGTPTKTVFWDPPGAVREHGLLEISDVEDFTVSGLVLELDGQLDYGVVVSRSCPGLTIENVTVLGPTVSGVRFVDAVATDDRPIRLDGVRIATQPRPKQPGSTAIEMTDGTGPVVIENCRLEGKGTAAIKVEGSVRTRFHNNRVYNFDQGIHLTGKSRGPDSTDLAVTNNTFHTLTKGGVIIESSRTGLGRFELSRNYFARTTAIVSTPAAKFAGLSASENARDKASKDGNLPVAAIELPGYDMPVPNVANDSQFLRPPPDRLDAVGPNKVAVGAR